MIIVTGAVIARPETFEALLEASLAHVHRSRLEPGCISHEVLIDAENPMRLTFLERWTDFEALQVHFRQPESPAFVAAARELAARSERMQIYTVQSRDAQAG
jgi:quinol monooxygenase YgiN